MRRAIVVAILAACLCGCGAWPLDLAVTFSRKPQWGAKVCLFVDELGLQAGNQRISGRVFGFVRGRDWWGAPTDTVWPPVQGVS